MPPRAIFTDLPWELRIMVYRDFFAQIKPIAIEDLRRADRPDDDYTLVPISSLQQFIDVCGICPQDRTAALKTLFRDYVPRHCYAARSIPGLKFLLNLPDLLPERRRPMNPDHASQLHEVKFLGLGFAAGRHYFDLVKWLLEEDEHIVRTVTGPNWHFTSESAGSVHFDGIDNDPKNPTGPADDVGFWELEVQLQRSGQPYVEFRIEVWPDAQFKMTLRGKLLLLRWDRARLRPLRDASVPGSVSERWQEAKDLTDEVAGWFEDDEDLEMGDEGDDEGGDDADADYGDRDEDSDMEDEEDEEEEDDPEDDAMEF